MRAMTEDRFEKGLGCQLTKLDEFYILDSNEVEQCLGEGSQLTQSQIGGDT